MNRRALLGSAAVVVGGGLAGCGGTGFSGTIGTNETPFSVEHSHDYDATPSGTRYVISVTATNDGNDPVPEDNRRPKFACVFRDESGDTIHETSRELLESIPPGGSVDLEFILAVDVDQAKRYVLSVGWAPDQESGE